MFNNPYYGFPGYAGATGGLAGGTVYPPPVNNQFNFPQNNRPDDIKVVFAPDTKSAEGLSLQPGGKVLVMIQDKPLFAFKTADQMGMVTTKYYRFEEYNPEAGENTFVTHSELDAKLGQLLETISGKLNPGEQTKEG